VTRAVLLKPTDQRFSNCRHSATFLYNLLMTLQLKVHCPVNTTPSLIPAAGHATASNFDAVPYAIEEQRPFTPALVHAVGGEVSDKPSINGGKVNNHTFLNFIQLCFTSICNCDWAGNEHLPPPCDRYSGTRLSVRAWMWETQTGSRDVDNTILWRLTAAPGATLWLQRCVVGRFWSSVINNGNRSSVLKPMIG